MDAPLPLTGTSITMRALAARAGELERDVTRAVMLIGPRGVGKRYLAQRIHRASALASVPLLVIDARRDDVHVLRTTLQRAPVASTLLVRHVDLLDTASQALLDHHVTERGAVARLMATTTTDIMAHVTAGSFLESLYYRLFAWPMLLPALADRGTEDLVALSQAVLLQTADEDSSLPVTLDAGAVTLLRRHEWTENLRELEAALALAQLRARGGLHVGAAHLSLQADGSVTPPADAPVADVERWHMLRAVTLFKGNRTHAARSLGVSRMTLISKLKLFGSEDGS